MLQSTRQAQVLLSSCSAPGRCRCTICAGLVRGELISDPCACRLGCIGLSIATYIVLAVGVSIYTRRNLGGRVYIAWPSWCFFVGCAAGLFWGLISLLTIAGKLLLLWGHR